MCAKKPRGLRPDEEELWARIARSAKPLRSPYSPAKPGKRNPDVGRTPVSQPPDIEPFRVGARSDTRAPDHDLRPTLRDELRSAPLAMDKKAFRQMSRGKIKPEARIDLHGMTVDRAHGALTSFILTSQTKGRRLVLVITGKGRETNDTSPIPTRTGVLRHQVPHWLSLPPLSSAVLQVSEAHRRHGGSGAFYVYLRRM